MHSGLTDLDALLLTVRNASTRAYLAEAIVAYRTGSYRLAIVGTWTAVTYDIIAKIRDLASDGDAAAVAFVDDFDRNVVANNLPRLLAIERDLIDTAIAPFAFIGPHDADALRRLRDDRGLCAHPAFSGTSELFRPVPDQVRAHVVLSVDALLARPPLSGNAIIAQFSADVTSSAFPRESERAVRYVAERYLARMRTTAIGNLATVLIKGITMHNVPEWDTREGSILDALDAISRSDLRYFDDSISVSAADFIERATAENLLRTIPLIRRFPQIQRRLRQTTRDRLHAIVVAGTHDAAVFGLLGLLSDDLDNALLARFPSLAPGDASGAVFTTRDPRLIPGLVDAFESAGSFREAEARLANVEVVADQLEASDFARIAIAVGENSQALYAIAIPPILTRLIRTALDRNRHGTINWAQLNRATARTTGFDDLWAMLAQRGVYVAHAETPPSSA